AVFDFPDFLRGDQRLANRLLLVGPRVVLDAPVDQRAHLVLVPRGRLDRVPSMLRHQNSFAIEVTRTNCSVVSMKPISSPRAATKTMITPVALCISYQAGKP